jgi:hypothetical protein
MSELSQLTIDINGNCIVLPESRKGGYNVRRDELSQEVQMISGRMVKELRGTVWRISYQYGYFNESDVKKLIDSCEKGRKTPILCAFLTQDSETLTRSFFVEDYTRPKFHWSRIVTEDGEETTVPVWADFSLELREVKPSD